MKEQFTGQRDLTSISPSLLCFVKVFVEQTCLKKIQMCTQDRTGDPKKMCILARAFSAHLPAVSCMPFYHFKGSTPHKQYIHNLAAPSSIHIERINKKTRQRTTLHNIITLVPFLRMCPRKRDLKNSAVHINFLLTKQHKKLIPPRPARFRFASVRFFSACRQVRGRRSTQTRWAASDLEPRISRARMGSLSRFAPCCSWIFLSSQAAAPLLRFMSMESDDFEWENQKHVKIYYKYYKEIHFQQLCEFT